MPAGTFDHISDTVNQPDFYFDIIGQFNLSRIFRNKFGLRRHNRFTLCGLGQLIPRPCPDIFIFYIRNDHLLHKPFDKRGFSGTHRTHHTQINFSVCPCFDIFI